MPDLLSNTLAFVVALGVIIFVHELGHLLVAKAFGVRVLTFSLGFGKQLWGFRRGETDYRVALVPLGGYVRLGGEDPAEVSTDPREFLNKPRWQRVLVYLAGPAMNVALSILLVAAALMFGAEITAIQDVPAVVGVVEPGSPGERAGLLPGDRVVAVAGREVDRWSDVQFAITTAPEQPIDLTVERGSRRLDVVLTPEMEPRYEYGNAGVFPELLPHVSEVLPGSPAERAGFQRGDEIRGVDGRALAHGGDFIAHIEQRAGVEVEVEVVRQGSRLVIPVVPEAKEAGVGRIGVGLSYTPRYGPVEALAESVRYNWELAGQTFAIIGKIASGSLKARSALSGPIEIAAQSGAAARRGFDDLIFLTGLISISVGILNLLPIPVLDGGQIFLLLVEGLIRRDLSMAIKERINQLGFVLIIMLMITVLYFDLVKNLPAGMLPGS